MKIAYLDCVSGISGDMTLGALVDAGVPLEKLNAAVGSLGLPGCRLVAREVKKHGFRATQVTVEYQPEHAHRHLHHILAMIDAGRLSRGRRTSPGGSSPGWPRPRPRSTASTVEKVHFHEVGAADSIADIVGTAVGWDLLGVERLVASPVPTGTRPRSTSPTASSAFPRRPRPSCCRVFPLAESAIEAELTTPTGAAILATLVDAFGPLPAHDDRRIGCGAGQRDLAEQANLLRLFVGEAAEASRPAEQVCVLETNLDDTSGELIGYCIERLWDAGALDVYTTAIQMKKNRPGVKLSRPVPRRPRSRRWRRFCSARRPRWACAAGWLDRRVLPRQAHQVETPWGPVEGKMGWPAGDRPASSPSSSRAAALPRSSICRWPRFMGGPKRPFARAR